MKKPKTKAKATAKTPAPKPSIPHIDPDAHFLQALDRAIDFHHNNTNDPHQLALAVSVALREVRKAFAHSRGLP